MSEAAAASMRRQQRPSTAAVDVRVAAIFANQRRWLRRMAAPDALGHGVLSQAGGLIALSGRCDGSIALPVGRSVSGTALDAAFAALRPCAPKGGVLVWSATSDEPLRRELNRRLLARGCHESFRPLWMYRDLMDPTDDLDDRPDPPGVRVRLAVPGDDAAIAAAADAGTPYTSRQEAAALIAHGSRPVSRQRAWLLIAVEEGNERGTGPVLGQVAVHLTSGQRGIAGIYSMGVAPAAQRRGIGRALIRAAADLGRQRGAPALGLNATPDGERLYRRLGFAVVGDGQTWHLPTARLGAPADPERVRLAEAIARGALATLDRFPTAWITTASLPNEESPLAFAARFAQDETARWLLGHGAPPELAAFWSLGWRDEAIALLNDPAAVNQRFGSERLTPLHEAIYRDDRELASLLIAAGADLTATDAQYHSTPLGWARALCRIELIPLLERAG